MSVTSVFFRFSMVFMFWALTLFFIDIEIDYKDGLHLKFNGWGAKLENFIKGRGE